MIQVKTEGGVLKVAGGPLGEGWMWVSSPYGPRDPFTIRLPDGRAYTTRGFHSGNDIAAPIGTPIRNIGPEGVITVSDWVDDSAEGMWVALRHSPEYTTRYFHLTAPVLPVGAKVPRGALLGFVGTTGLSTGPHLHFDMTYKGNNIDSLGTQALAFLNSRPDEPRTFTNLELRGQAAAAVARGEYDIEIEGGRKFLVLDRILLPE